MGERDLPALIDADALRRRLAEPDVRVLDASWHLPASGRDAAGEFAEGHIPGAGFFDIDRIADPGSDLPHMLPAAGEFAAAVGALGIDNDSDIIVYEQQGLFSAPRAWWMFRVFGHERVAILDGGLAAWRAAGHPVERGAAQPVAAARFVSAPRRDLVRHLGDMQDNLGSRRETVLDARPAARFAGSAPEPRPGLPSGHIPGAANLPFDRITDPDTGRMLSTERLGTLFDGVDERPVACTCGTGVTACVLAFALYRLGRTDVAVYDGSWAEWAAGPNAAIETGAPGD